MKRIYGFLFLAGTLLFSCKKDWLDAKPNKSLVVPATVADLQAMLDNTTFIFNNGQPSLGEIGSDDYHVPYPAWQALYYNTERNAYIWAKNVYNNEPVFDWILPYQRIFYENYVLENIDKIVPAEDNIPAWNNVKGSALFGRAFDFYSLADLFTKPYDSSTAANDPGLPLRLHADINGTSSRATVQQTYDRIIEDLDAAIPLLPAVPAYKTRPSRASAYAMLARVYLNTGDFARAGKYADSSIMQQSTLMDYNALDLTSSFPFPMFNDEVIYHAVYNYPTVISSYTSIVDSGLYRSYANDDLRKYAYIDTSDGNPRFKGGYDGYTVFAGIAVDEMYLVSAECNAREGKITQGMNILNALLVNRWRTGTFVPVTAADAGEALRLILQQRRQELLYRGLRWTDLRRLNKDSRFAITLTRMLNGTGYQLPPGDNRYVYPIPDAEIQLSGIAQNPR